MEYGIEKSSNKLLALTEVISNTWVAEVKQIRAKELSLTAARLHALRDNYSRTIIMPLHLFGSGTFSVQA